MQNDIVLSMRAICKAFPGVRALQNVDFTLCKGEIHALMGENGAGQVNLNQSFDRRIPERFGANPLDG